MIVGRACAQGLVIAVSGSLAAIAMGQIPYRVVVRTGQAAPVSEPNVVFDDLESPLVNASGQVCFFASLDGPGVDYANDRALWLDTAGTTVSVVREGEYAPGTSPGTYFTSLPSLTPRLNALGEVTFVGHLDPAHADEDHDRGLWAGLPGALELVVLEGDPAPGTNLTFFVPFESYSIYVSGSAGAIAFSSFAWDGGYQDGVLGGLWTTRTGSLNLLQHNECHPPGTAQETTYWGDFEGLAINSAGQSVFRSGLSHDQPYPHNRGWGIWSDRSGTLAMVAGDQQAAPGTPEGTVFWYYYEYLNEDLPWTDTGKTAFRSRLIGPSITYDNDFGIWAEWPGGLTLVMQEGDPVPGLPAGTFFDHPGYGGPLLMGGAGDVVFDCVLTGENVTTANDRALWRGLPAGCELIAREGDPVPGTGEGVGYKYFYPGCVNNCGQVGFSAAVAGPGIDVSNDQGVWMTDRSGHVVAVLREGDLLEVGPGDVRTVASAGSPRTAGTEDGRAHGLSDDGELALLVRFTDGSKAIVVFSITIWRPEQGGDYDGDGDVDLHDYAGLQRCFSGSSPASGAGWGAFDSDWDGDVDITDGEAFVAEMSGP